MKSWRKLNKMQSSLFMILSSALCCLLAVAVDHREVSAQGICIPDPLTVTQMEGRVVYLSSQGEEPVAKAIVELFEYGYNGRRLTKVLTDDNGYFRLRKRHLGKYLLKASKPPYLLRFAVRVNLVRKKPRVDHGRIVIALGTNPLQPCGGGSAAIQNVTQP